MRPMCYIISVCTVVLFPAVTGFLFASAATEEGNMEIFFSPRCMGARVVCALLYQVFSMSLLAFAQKRAGNVLG